MNKRGEKMSCSKCNKEISAEGKCMGCNLSQEECNCPIVDQNAESETSDESSVVEESEEKEVV